MTDATIHGLPVAGDWLRLHRAESDILATLLSASESAAVARRLGLPPSASTAWVPPTAGAYGGRFAEPYGPGALYLGHNLETCLAEVLHHHARICATSIGTPPGSRGVFRQLVFSVVGTFADATKSRVTGLHSPDTYTPSWAYGRRVRTANLDGVHYRRGTGHRLAIFNEPAATFSRIEFGAVVLEWDGTASHRIA